MGSYLVNAIGDCNGCHTSGGPPNFNYTDGHNPYFQFQMSTKVDPANYLAGGSLAKKHGLTVTSEKVGDSRTYSIKA